MRRTTCSIHPPTRRSAATPSAGNPLAILVPCHRIVRGGARKSRPTTSAAPNSAGSCSNSSASSPPQAGPAGPTTPCRVRPSAPRTSAALAESHLAAATPTALPIGHPGRRADAAEQLSQPQRSGAPRARAAASRALRPHEARWWLGKRCQRVVRLAPSQLRPRARGVQSSGTARAMSSQPGSDG